MKDQNNKIVVTLPTFIFSILAVILIFVGIYFIKLGQLQKTENKNTIPETNTVSSKDILDANKNTNQKTNTSTEKPNLVSTKTEKETNKDKINNNNNNNNNNSKNDSTEIEIPIFKDNKKEEQLPNEDEVRATENDLAERRIIRKDIKDKNIVLAKTYSNYAWGVTEEGTIIFDDGSIYTYIFSGTRDPDAPYSNYQTLLKYNVSKHGGKKLQKISQQDIARIQELSKNIKGIKYEDARNGGNDIGEYSITVFPSKVKSTTLALSGDLIGQDESKETEEILNILKKYNLYSKSIIGF